MVGLTPFENMNALQKIGMVLQNIADPSTIPRYQTSLNEQIMFGLKQQELADRQKQRSALAQLSQDMVPHGAVPSMPGVMGPLQPSQGMDPGTALARMGAITGDPSALINYNIEQNDPLRKLEIDYKRKQISELGRVEPKIIETATGDIVAVNPQSLALQTLFDAPDKPTLPATTGLPEGYMWGADGAATPIPGLALSNLPKTTGLPTGQMWGQDESGRPVAVNIPGAVMPQDEQALERQVTHYSTKADTFAGLATSLKTLDDVVTGYGKKDIPGVGAGAMTPGWALSSEANDVRMAAIAVGNQLLNLRSGGSVTDGESSRLANELGIEIASDGTIKISTFRTDDQLRKGIRNVKSQLAAKLKNLGTGLSPEAAQLYKDRGGSVPPDLFDGQAADPLGIR